MAFCGEPHGNTMELVCPYHQLSYALDGQIKGGMSPDFDHMARGLTRLKVAVNAINAPMADQNRLCSQKTRRLMASTSE